MKRSKFLAAFAASPLGLAIARYAPSTPLLKVCDEHGVQWATYRLPSDALEDASPIVQRALNLAATLEGGHVVLPAGKYTVLGGLSF